MPNPPRRFQIHLSTASVMMFAAGALIWANVYGGTKMLFGVKERDRVYVQTRSHGWPFEAYATTELIDTLANNPPYEEQLGSGIRVKGLVANSLLALASLIAVCVLCEWLIRRRVARKEA